MALTPKLMNKPQSLRGSADTKVLVIGLSEYELFVVQKKDMSATVFMLDQNTIDEYNVGSGRNAARPEHGVVFMAMLTRYPASYPASHSN